MNYFELIYGFFFITFVDRIVGTQTITIIRIIMVASTSIIGTINIIIISFTINIIVDTITVISVFFF